MELTSDIRSLLDLTISLTGEKDYNRLLEGIIKTAMEISSCDGGTLYMATPQGLKFKIMRTISMDIYRGGDGEEIDLPVVELGETNVCAYSAIHRKIINIEDVYNSDLFDFTGPKKYDAITGYRTCSMLVVPLISHEEELLGVLQLINAQDMEGQVVPFDKSLEYVIFSLASQASVSLANMMHLWAMRDLLDSAICAFSKAIDERTPYNAHHTENVARYCDGFADYLLGLSETDPDHCIMDEPTKTQLVMAARLHDVGKLIVPLEVMNKANRLSPETMDRVRDRFSYIRLLHRLHRAEGSIDQEDYERLLAQTDAMLETIVEADQAPFLQDELLEKIQQIAESSYEDESGVAAPYITPEERELLSIRKGTLSANERKIMESHVVMTSTILDEIHFDEYLKEVPVIAGSHHEYLNGTGYPRGIRGEDISPAMRIITIADIYDSLCASDRPYKKAMPPERAMKILKEMAGEGKLDSHLVDLFCSWQEAEVEKTDIGG